jgi:hypothetical protein
VPIVKRLAPNARPPHNTIFGRGAQPEEREMTTLDAAQTATLLKAAEKSFAYVPFCARSGVWRKSRRGLGLALGRSRWETGHDQEEP